MKTSQAEQTDADHTLQQYITLCVYLYIYRHILYIYSLSKKRFISIIIFGSTKELHAFLVNYYTGIIYGVKHANENENDDDNDDDSRTDSVTKREDEGKNESKIIKKKSDARII